MLGPDDVAALCLHRVRMAGLGRLTIRRASTAVCSVRLLLPTLISMQDFEIKTGRRYFTEAELTAMAVAEGPAGALIAPVPASLNDEEPVYKNIANGRTALRVGLIMLLPARTSCSCILTVSGKHVRGPSSLAHRSQMPLADAHEHLLQSIEQGSCTVDCHIQRGSPIVCIVTDSSAGSNGARRASAMTPHDSTWECQTCRMMPAARNWR